MKINFLILLSVFILSPFLNSDFSFAAESQTYHLGCDNHGFGVHIVEKNDRIYLLIRNEYGPESFPLYSGPVTGMSLNSIQMAHEDLAVFKDRVQVSWQKSLCSFDSKNKMIMSCNGEGEIEYPQTELKTFTFNSMLTHQETTMGNFDLINFHWLVTSKSLTHFVPFEFPLTNCKVY